MSKDSYNILNIGYITKFYPRGAGGVPKCHPKSYFFYDLKPHAKFHNPTITPSGRKVTRRREERREKREKNNTDNSGHFVSVTAHATTQTKTCATVQYKILIKFYYYLPLPQNVISPK